MSKAPGGETELSKKSPSQAEMVDIEYFVFKSTFMIHPDEPFQSPLTKRWIPREMTAAPALKDAARPGPVESRYALLINPFYPKDANASFGKHVLTPTLALTSFAATSPPHWR